MHRFRTLSAVAVVSALALAACSDDGNDAATTTAPATEMPDGETQADIVTIASTTEGFTTLVAAVQAAGLVETLQGEGPFTVFAPTDEAFAALPDGVLDSLLLPENLETLTRILTYHVVAGEVMSSDITPGEVPTVEGSNVALDTADGVTVNGANVTVADVDASNGVIHVIDAVILPEDIAASL